jgi:hypothetical protein
VVGLEERSHPIGYPSYTDDHGQTASSLAQFVGLPTTVFLETAGKATAVHIGQYRHATALARDIRLHALQGEG